MMIKIDYDLADEIVRYGLMDTYISLTNDLKSTKNIDEDDLKIWQETVAAIEVLGNWYFFDFKNELMNYKKEQKK